MMQSRLRAVLAVAAVVPMAALIVAPVAQARPTCQSGPTQTVCETRGSVNIKVRPGTTAPPANRPGVPWIGLPGRR